jgi:squalene cyclase
MAKTDFSEQAELIRNRLVERAAQNCPFWHTPFFPVSRANAGCLLIGQLLGKLPVEDARALACAIVAEQNEDGSWSKLAGHKGDLSLTLEVVQALSVARSTSVEAALGKAVSWLETHRGTERIEPETMLLLGALTEPSATGNFSLRTRLLALFDSVKIALRRDVGSSSFDPMLNLLRKSKAEAHGQYQILLQTQRDDGSWNGSSRTTVFALVTLKHAGLPIEDSAFERGWRYLRSQQEWNSDGLALNPCDVSNLIHATAVRALMAGDDDSDLVAGSALSLLHQARGSGGWGVGGLSPTDLFTTAIALDALSFVGDLPLETAWTRRRAVYLLLRTQLRDGGWPLYPIEKPGMIAELYHRIRSSVDVTALAVQALAYNQQLDPAVKKQLDKGVRFLLKRQRRNGLWESDVVGSTLFATSRSIEALSALQHSNYAPIQSAVRRLLALQNKDGGWGEKITGESKGMVSTESNPLHTACVVRALQAVPQPPVEAIYRARRYLERSLDDSGLLWTTDVPAMPLPFNEDLAGLHDLTTLWALEAWSPLGETANPRGRFLRKSRGIFEGNK